MSSQFLSRIQDAAVRLNLDCCFIDKKNGRLLRLTQGSKSSLFGAAPIKLWPFNNALSMSIVEDKELTYRILQDVGIGVPQTRIGFKDISAYTHLDNPPIAISEILGAFDFSYPVVVKPNLGKAAAGLSIIHEQTTLQEAAELAGTISNGILVQEYIDGKDYRIYALHGEPILLLERTTTTLYGDGQSTVEELVLLRHEAGNYSNSFELSLKSFLKQHKEKIYPSGCPIPVYPVSNLTQGGKAIEIISEVKDHWKKLCVTLFQVLKLEFMAIDCRISDQAPGEIKVIEVNSNPGIEMLYEAAPGQADSVLDRLVLTALEH
ncbi:MAG: hypothetical protein COB67_08360 [SAR324 cluster bacterium]|uniref:ATP-grasp domain-containing protein n=1 Tax=SAR324 cluster bacterium TaxID=2024889 RepID=A0A2A4T2F9_9DELT|nr:MAG: hypothetical protein COB67_08360 [SAR324 cluster bacterium]